MQLPKITINRNSKISIRRLLPVPGEVLVQPGQRVEALTPVATTEIPSGYRIIDVARQLGLTEPDLSEVMQVEQDEFVEANEVIATRQGSGLLSKRSIKAPAAGYVAVIGPGWVLLETEHTTVELQAFVNGVISRVISDRGVLIETDGVMIEAACGFGGEAYGRLNRLVNSPFETLQVEAIDESSSEAIILGGRTVDEEMLRQAEKWRVRGIIVGSIPASLLRLEPPTKVRVVATEGFGDIPMSAYTFGILTSLNRREVSIRGSNPFLPGSVGFPRQEPPLILASSKPRSAERNYTSAPAPKKSEATIGSRVRIIRGKSLGASGIIEAIPPEPQITAAGIVAPGAQVKLNSETVFIPWANLEQVD